MRRRTEHTTSILFGGPMLCLEGLAFNALQLLLC